MRLLDGSKTQVPIKGFRQPQHSTGRQLGSIDVSQLFSHESRLATIVRLISLASIDPVDNLRPQHILTIR